MAFSFTPYLDWVDVPDPDNPPAGAKKIAAEDLLRYENGLKTAAAESATYAAKLVDTGERLLNATATQAEGTVHITRRDKSVEIILGNVRFSDAQASFIYVVGFVPDGFRPSRNKYMMLNNGVEVRVQANGTLLIYGHYPTQLYRGILSFFTQQAEPNPLPGTPA